MTAAFSSSIKLTDLAAHNRRLYIATTALTAVNHNH
ncbi:hypothetical protein GGR33_003836 [Methylobacterium brachythecii]|uniref:Uncharacterized protein n=1 Tax=Methylobacterium brachythecii TaxID=1176177 RepID=A0A7W6AJ50_9HYPH|nr:hypothetical protein [Methylobacterium brachythecii]